MEGKGKAYYLRGNPVALVNYLRDNPVPSANHTQQLSSLGEEARAMGFEVMSYSPLGLTNDL